MKKNLEVMVHYIYHFTDQQCELKTKFADLIYGENMSNPVQTIILWILNVPILNWINLNDHIQWMHSKLFSL